MSSLSVRLAFAAASIALFSASSALSAPPPGTDLGAVFEDDGARAAFIAEQQARMVHAVEIAQSVPPEAQLAQVNAFLRDRTLRYFDFAHGVQIEYMAPDGSAHLWYPLNGRVVRGQWLAAVVDGEARLCFAYRGRTIDPVTGSTNGQSCSPAASYLAQVDIYDSRPGDAFGLTGRVPFRITNIYTMPDWPSAPVAP